MKSKTQWYNTVKMKKIGIWLVYGLLYETLALIVNRPIILPDLALVFSHVFQHLLTIEFYRAISFTLVRVILGTLMALGLAIVAALAAYKLKFIDLALRPLLILVKTLPNITYILLILIWFSREVSVSLITLLIVFPVCYGQINAGLLGITLDQLEVLKVYPESWMESIMHVYLPLILPSLLEALSLALSLGFKVGVMAEILGQVQPGLGYLLYTAKMNFDIAEVFALSVWMILWVVLVEKGIQVWRRSHSND